MRNSGVVVDRPRRHVAEALIERDGAHLRAEHHPRRTDATGLGLDGGHHQAPHPVSTTVGGDSHALGLHGASGHMLEAGGAHRIAVVVDGDQVNAGVVFAVELKVFGNTLLLDEHGASESEAAGVIGGTLSEMHVHDGPIADGDAGANEAHTVV